VVLHRDWLMSTAGQRRRSIIGAVIISFALISACTPDSGPRTFNEPSYKTQLVFGFISKDGDGRQWSIGRSVLVSACTLYTCLAEVG
jgi:hypothetical protein